jgi:tetratricopeptide (TPR) repeat protein
MQPSTVTDDTFADSVHTLLRDGNASVARQSLLAGVVQRQLAHAAERLKSKQRERGLSSVVGGLYLVRSGELRPEMLDATAERALDLAAGVVAASGDEGRAQAMYELRRFALAPTAPGRADVEEHLAALGTWITDSAKKTDLGPTELTGQTERRLVMRALLLPTDEAQREATVATARWVDAGLAFQSQFRAQPHVRPRREEAVEGFRAVSSGAATLAALFLRHGDAAGAVEAISSTSVDQVAPPGLMQRLVAAARGKDPNAWRELLELFGKPDGRDDETSVDRNLLAAAMFGVAVEGYRRDPGAVDLSMHLAVLLSVYGMPEVAPTVLADAATRHPDANVLAAMLEMVGRSMAREESDDDPASARRTFTAAAQLLAIADRSPVKSKLSTTPARLRALAATIDSRAGELASARTLLISSLADEPNAEGQRLLADVERGLGNGPAALAALAQVSASPEARRDRNLDAEAHLAASDIHRELGARDKAKEELTLAIAAAAEARRTTQGGSTARAERALARALDRLGDDAGAARATDRSIVAARSDARQLAATVLDALARAFVAKDLPAARRIAKLGVGEGLRDDERVYVGLWLTLLERELRVSPDGTAQSVLTSIEPGAGWAGRLAAWANAKITDADLVAAARTPGQRTEAAFYRAMARRAAGDAAGADGGLREVAGSKTLDLMESQIARDLLAGTDRRLPGPMPPGVSLP